jgi:hypothetical protein
MYMYSIHKNVFEKNPTRFILILCLSIKSLIALTWTFNIDHTFKLKEFRI